MRRASAKEWTFLSNHAHVLLCLRRDASVTMKEIAALVGVTERAVQRIIHELEAAGYLTRQREGRRNGYQLREDLPLRHPLEARHAVGVLLRAVS